MGFMENPANTFADLDNPYIVTKWLPLAMASALGQSGVSLPDLGKWIAVKFFGG